MKLSAKDILTILLFIAGITIYLLLEMDFQKGYKERREQEKIEHEFYEQHHNGK